MPEIPPIPKMVMPSSGSTMLFVVIVAFVAVSIVYGIWRGGHKTEASDNQRFWGIAAIVGMIVWLATGAIIPWSGILETPMLPPPPLFLIAAGFLLALGLAVSQTGRRLANLPVTLLIGFHVFRLPLELVLHRWYECGTLPVQMTYSGHNFDIATGVLALVIGAWACFGAVPRSVVWFFNIAGSLLLATVITIALTSSPVPFRQYTNEPQVLLVFHFPYSWIATIAVTGAMFGHLVLFRKLINWHP